MLKLKLQPAHLLCRGPELLPGSLVIVVVFEELIGGRARTVCDEVVFTAFLFFV